MNQSDQFQPKLLSRHALQKELRTISQPSYRLFAQSLVPGSAPMLGIRLPALQSLATRLAKLDWRTLLDRVMTRDVAVFYEETLLRGFLIATAAMEPTERFDRVDGFVDEIHDWATCDAFCARLKFVRKIPEQCSNFFDRHHYLTDPRPFARRFGIVMLLDHGLRVLEPDVVLAELRRVRYRDSTAAAFGGSNRNESRDGEYYVRMALAWALSMAFVRWPDRIERTLADGTFSLQIRTMTIRKILESRQVSAELKKRLRDAK